MSEDEVAAAQHDERKKALDKWFDKTLDEQDKKSVFAPAQEGVRYRCPCCHYKTLPQRGRYDICPVCFWEDDGQDGEDAGTKRFFSPNHMSLMQGREQYRRYGASQERFVPHVRAPLPEEL